MNKMEPSESPIPKCVWHDEIQSCIKEIDNLIENHEPRVLTEEESNESKLLNSKFENGPSKAKVTSMRQRIKHFYAKPSLFKMKELQILVEDEIKGRDASLSNKEVNEELIDLSKKIVVQLKKELREKFEGISEKDLNKKLHELNVKGHLTGDLDKYQSDKSEYKEGLIEPIL